MPTVVSHTRLELKISRFSTFSSVVLTKNGFLSYSVDTRYDSVDRGVFPVRLIAGFFALSRAKVGSAFSFPGRK